MKTSDQIIDYLKKHKQATAEEISQHLFVTATDIRYHLKILINAGIVTPIGKIKTGKRGRPKTTYSLAKFPLRLEYICRALLNFIYNTSQETNDSIQEQLVSIFIQDNFSQTYELAYDTQSPTRLLKEAVEYLTGHGYKAKWEARHTGPILTLQTCPYQSLIDEFPQLCDFDCHLIEAITQHKIQSFSKYTYVNNRYYPCRFILSRKP